MEAHGGYLFQVEQLDVDLVSLGRKALEVDGQDAQDTSLWVCAIPGRRVVRVAYDAPFTYGKKGAHWYRKHHALARLLSSFTALAVHAYVFDPDDMEEVAAYADGQKVGGDALSYDSVDLPAGAGVDLDDSTYDEMLVEWPLGRLARIFGVTRNQLLGLPRSNGVLVGLDGSGSSEDLASLFFDVPAPQRTTRAKAS